MKADRRAASAVANRPAPPKDSPFPWFGVLAGVFFLIVIIKFGDPVVIDAVNVPPKSMDEVLFGPWPPAWGRWLLVPVALAGLLAAQLRQTRLRWILLVPLAWLFWQFVSASQSIDPTLTRFTLPHFAACVTLFYLGYFGLNGNRWPWPVAAGLALALCWEMRAGVQQHFGGLEATRKYIYSAYGSNWADFAAKSPDFAKRITTNRVFGDFVSPNALAGALLLFLPMTLVFVWQLTPKVSRPARIVFVAILGGCGLAVLFWSGSKAGWLLTLVLMIIALLHFNLRLKWKIGVVALLLVAGLAGFAIRNSGYFERGATSVSARFDYWKAGVQTLVRHPVLGTGPGTFGRSYQRLKDPRSEMSWLCHNDYLEQGSDSGVPGLILYVFFVVSSLFAVYRYRFGQNWNKEPLVTAISLGVVAVCLHSFVEYHLYIPALAWPTFFLLGWLWRLE